MARGGWDARPSTAHRRRVRHRAADVASADEPGWHEVCAELRARDNVVKIIMLTETRERVRDGAGAGGRRDDYVTKPFGLAELRIRIREVLAGRIQRHVRCDKRC